MVHDTVVMEEEKSPDIMYTRIDVWGRGMQLDRVNVQLLRKYDTNEIERDSKVLTNYSQTWT